MTTTSFPFVHEVAGEFERHRDVERFTAGLSTLPAADPQWAERAEAGVKG